MSIDWSNLFSWQNLVSLLDVLVVWYVIYMLMMLLRGTKAVQLFRGIVVIIFIKFANYNRKENEAEIKLVDALDQAIQYMSKRRIGALITVQMNTGLDDYIETGIPLDADVSGALLINIFIPNTPLHDGAVIIKDNRIAVAAAYLPLSESNLIPKELGTRHRAAVGISEVTDALTIVVSEETGGVTITKNNELIRDLTQQDYRKLLYNELVPTQEEKTNAVARFFTEIFGKRGQKH